MRYLVLMLVLITAVAITAQMAALTACLEVITLKVKLYQASLADGSADPIWAPPEGTRPGQAPGTGPG